MSPRATRTRPSCVRVGVFPLWRVEPVSKSSRGRRTGSGRAGRPGGGPGLARLGPSAIGDGRESAGGERGRVQRHRVGTERRRRQHNHSLLVAFCGGVRSRRRRRPHFFRSRSDTRILGSRGIRSCEVGPSSRLSRRALVLVIILSGLHRRAASLRRGSFGVCGRLVGQRVVRSRVLQVMVLSVTTRWHCRAPPAAAHLSLMTSLVVLKDPRPPPLVVCFVLSCLFGVRLASAAARESLVP